ncbi:hypothetical protein Tco_0734285 [Tanacetum coccineum]
MAKDGYKVQLHVYDLSNVLSRQLSMSDLGEALEAKWSLVTELGRGFCIAGKKFGTGGSVRMKKILKAGKNQQMQLL